ncbi:hypothetical protein BH18ACT1_BH18ACT1_06080 [soil metagenome]
MADLFFVPFRTPKGDGDYGSGYAIVPRDSAGQTILDNWDALGMRGSGSNGILYEDCFVPDAFVDVSETWGEDTVMSLLIGTVGSIGLLGAFLGVAKAARALVVDMARTRRKAPSGRALALTISGGAGYLRSSPLARLYRDVRAGPFMQPLSPNETYEDIGKVALALPPDLES